MVITTTKIKKYFGEHGCQIGPEALLVLDSKVVKMMNEVIWWTGGGKRIKASDVHRIIIKTEKGV